MLFAKYTQCKASIGWTDIFWYRQSYLINLKKYDSIWTALV